MKSSVNVTINVSFCSLVFICLLGYGGYKLYTSPYVQERLNTTEQSDKIDENKSDVTHEVKKTSN